MPRGKWQFQKRKLTSTYRDFFEPKFTASVDHALVCRLTAADLSTSTALAAVYA